jgi:hypothetical protein
MNVNLEQRHTAAEFYTNAIQNVNIASNSMTAAKIGNDDALGQALFMVGNAAVPSREVCRRKYLDP